MKLLTLLALPMAFALPASLHSSRAASAFNGNDVRNAISAIDTGESDIQSASSKVVKAGEAAYASFSGTAQSSLGTLYANYKKDLASALAYLDKIQSGLDKARSAYQKGDDVNKNFWF